MALFGVFECVDCAGVVATEARFLEAGIRLNPPVPLCMCGGSAPELAKEMKRVGWEHGADEQNAVRKYSGFVA